MAADAGVTLRQRKQLQWAKERAEQEDYFPFGRPGAGAPVKASPVGNKPLDTSFDKSPSQPPHGYSNPSQNGYYTVSGPQVMHQANALSYVPSPGTRDQAQFFPPSVLPVSNGALPHHHQQQQQHVGHYTSSQQHGVGVPQYYAPLMGASPQAQVVFVPTPGPDPGHFKGDLTQFRKAYYGAEATSMPYPGTMQPPQQPLAVPVQALPTHYSHMQPPQPGSQSMQYATSPQGFYLSPAPQQPPGAHMQPSQPLSPMAHPVNGFQPGYQSSSPPTSTQQQLQPTSQNGSLSYTEQWANSLSLWQQPPGYVSSGQSVVEMPAAGVQQQGNRQQPQPHTLATPAYLTPNAAQQLGQSMGKSPGLPHKTASIGSESGSGPQAGLHNINLSGSYSGPLSPSMRPKPPSKITDQRDPSEVEEYERRRADTREAIETQILDRRKRQFFEAERERQELERTERERQMIEMREELENEQERSKWKEQAWKEQQRESQLREALTRAQEEASLARRNKLYMHAAKAYDASIGENGSSLQPLAMSQRRGSFSTARSMDPGASRRTNGRSHSFDTEPDHRAFNQYHHGSSDAGHDNSEHGSIVSASAYLTNVQPARFIAPTGSHYPQDFSGSSAKGSREVLHDVAATRSPHYSSAEDESTHALGHATYHEEGTPVGGEYTTPHREQQGLLEKDNSFTYDDRPIRPQQVDPVKIWEQLGYAVRDAEDQENSSSSPTAKTTPLQRSKVPLRQSMRKSRSVEATAAARARRNRSAEGKKVPDPPTQDMAPPPEGRKKSEPAPTTATTGHPTVVEPSGKRDVLRPKKAAAPTAKPAPPIVTAPTDNSWEMDVIEKSKQKRQPSASTYTVVSTAADIGDLQDSGGSSKKKASKGDETTESKEPKKSKSKAAKTPATASTPVTQPVATPAVETTSDKENVKKDKAPLKRDNSPGKVGKKVKTAVTEPVVPDVAAASQKPDNPYGDTLGGLNPLLQPISTRKKSKTKPTPTAVEPEQLSPVPALSSTPSSLRTTSESLVGDANAIGVSGASKDHAATASSSSEKLSHVDTAREKSPDGGALGFNTKTPLRESMSLRSSKPSEKQQQLLQQLSALRLQLKNKQEAVEKALLNSPRTAVGGNSANSSVHEVSI